MTFLIMLIIGFAFFAQSLLGFGGGLICIPLLSLFMPIQDVVAMVMIYQFSMGILIFSTHKDICWRPLISMLPAMMVGVCIGVVLLTVLDGDVLRGFLAGYIILHLARKYTAFDPLGFLIKRSEVHVSGFFGGFLNAMIGGGAPAFTLYLKDIIPDVSAFRASMIAVLMLANIPKAIGVIGMGLLPWDLFLQGMVIFPVFLFALYAGQKLHRFIPRDLFFKAVELVLVFAALSLILKIVF